MTRASEAILFSDKVYVNLYVENMAKNLGKDLNIESLILMHDGSLVAFSTTNGVSLNNHTKLERSEIKEQDIEHNIER